MGRVSLLDMLRRAPGTIIARNGGGKFALAITDVAINLPNVGSRAADTSTFFRVPFNGRGIIVAEELKIAAAYGGDVAAGSRQIQERLTEHISAAGESRGGKSHPIEFAGEMAIAPATREILLTTPIYLMGADRLFPYL